MISKIKSIRYNVDLFDAVLVGLATLAGSFFSYLLQFVLGRKLSVVDYGTFNALLSLSSLVGVLASVFGTSLIKVVAEIYAKKDIDKIKFLFLKLIVFSLIAGLTVFSVITLLSGYFSSSLKIEDSFLVVLFALSLGVSFLIVIPNAYMQGMQKFKEFSIFHIIHLFIRFLIPTVLLLTGFGLRGVFSGLPIAVLVAFLIGCKMVDLNLKKTTKSDLSSYYKKMISFSLSFLVVNFCMTALSNIDLIMVKKYFSPIDAGYYAGTVTLGKILLFGSGAISIVMFPKVVALFEEGKYFLSKLRKLLFMLLLILSVGVFCYWVLPGTITRLFFGKTFENSVPFLPMFSIFVALYALINFFVTFFLAVDKKKVGLLIIPGVILQYVLLSVFHKSIFDVIKVNIGVGLFTLFILSIYFFFSIPSLRNNKKVKIEGVSEVPQVSI